MPVSCLAACMLIWLVGCNPPGRHLTHAPRFPALPAPCGPVPQKADLARMYRMFNRLPKGLEPMALPSVWHRTRHLINACLPTAAVATALPAPQA